MRLADSLTSRDQIGFELCLGRMALGAFGALETLPLYCLGELATPDFTPAVDERYEIWKSLLTSSREILKPDRPAWEKADPAIVKLIGITRELRNAFVELGDFQKLTTEQALTSHQRLVDAYGRIPVCVDELRNALVGEVDLAPLTARVAARHKYSESALRWFGEELQTKTRREHETLTEAQGGMQ